MARFHPRYRGKVREERQAEPWTTCTQEPPSTAATVWCPHLNKRPTSLLEALPSGFMTKVNPWMRRCRRVSAGSHPDPRDHESRSSRPRGLLLAAKVLGLACVAALGTLPAAVGFGVGGSLWSSRVQQQRGSASCLGFVAGIGLGRFQQDRASPAAAATVTAWPPRGEAAGRGVVLMATGRRGKDVPLNPPNKGSGRAPLKGEEEIDLARKMQVRVAYIRVKYLAREQLGRDPTHKEWADVLGITDKQLGEALTAAADAKTIMIRANMRLVMSIVRRYLTRGVQLKDLLQEGMNGLVRAAEKFDPEKGFKFSTYATWWIKQSVMRAVAEQSRVVRLPMHIHDMLNQISKAERELQAQYGRQPTEAEIAARVDIPQRKLQFLRERTQHTLSMDATRPGGGRKSSGIGDEIRVSDSISDSEPLQDVKADEAYMREQVEKLLDSLNPREADVVKMRYGLVDGQQRTLEEIGVAFRVTRERVRQIEARALHKIKQPYRCHKLRDHVIVDREAISQSVFGFRNDAEMVEAGSVLATPAPSASSSGGPSERSRRSMGSTGATSGRRGSRSSSSSSEGGVLVGAGSAPRRRRSSSSSSSSRGKSSSVEYAFSGSQFNATLAG